MWVPWSPTFTELFFMVTLHNPFVNPFLLYLALYHLGGIFGYPADSKSKKGKLRILYEVFPMAFLIEQAGGKATTGTQNALDIIPEHIHDRSGIWLGSKEDVEELESFYKK
jgi:fructose-1,6-bisphosphatase